MTIPGICKGPVFPTPYGRRSFIQAGVLSGFGLSLADLFANEVRTEALAGKRAEG